ncbi:MAG: zinc ribbon domain-containing protein [Anaerolineae bacterium]|nr:zinc ribbon domain-containing protein [Anaerolineae bacterium]
MRKQRYALEGEVCSHCGAKVFPPRPVCPHCGYGLVTMAEQPAFIPKIELVAVERISSK